MLIIMFIALAKSILGGVGRRKTEDVFIFAVLVCSAH